LSVSQNAALVISTNFIYRLLLSDCIYSVSCGQHNMLTQTRAQFCHPASNI